MKKALGIDIQEGEHSSVSVKNGIEFDFHNGLNLTLSLGNGRACDNGSLPDCPERVGSETSRRKHQEGEETQTGRRDSA